MVNIKVLALNKDDTIFHFGYDTTGYDVRGFIKILAKYHNEIRYVCFSDIPEEAQRAFEVIDGDTRAMSYGEAFDFLYDFYGKDW